MTSRPDPSPPSTRDLIDQIAVATERHFALGEARDAVVAKAKAWTDAGDGPTGLALREAVRALREMEAGDGREER